MEKSIQEKEIEKELKYAKTIKNDLKSEISEVHSENNLTAAFNSQLEDSRETIQKVRHYSREKRDHYDMKRQGSIEKAEATKLFDSISGVSNANTDKRSNADKNDEYYIYWKGKAHEYLESNMKLMEQVRKLTKENEELKELVDRIKTREEVASRVKMQTTSYDEKELTNEIRKVSLMYMTKIEEMEKELKRKEIVISSYELKVNEINNKIAGDGERVKLMGKMNDEIEQLKRENAVLRAEIAKREGISKEESMIEKSTRASSFKTMIK